MTLDPKGREAMRAEAYALGVHENRAAQIVEAYLRAASPAPEGWRTMESAPKDGTVVLLYGEWAGEIHGPAGRSPTIDIGRWTDGHSDYPGDDWWALDTGDAYACWMRPTHWHPLPAAPVPEPGNSNG